MKKLIQWIKAMVSSFRKKEPIYYDRIGIKPPTRRYYFRPPYRYSKFVIFTNCQYCNKFIEINESEAPFCTTVCESEYSDMKYNKSKFPLPNPTRGKLLRKRPSTGTDLKDKVDKIKSDIEELQDIIKNVDSGRNNNQNE